MKVKNILGGKKYYKDGIRSGYIEVTRVEENFIWGYYYQKDTFIDSAWYLKVDHTEKVWFRQMHSWELCKEEV